MSNPHAHPHPIKKSHTKFQKDRHKNVTMLTRHLLIFFFFFFFFFFFKVGITSKPRTYHQTTKQTHTGFQKDGYKILDGVALTMYPIIASDMPKCVQVQVENMMKINDDNALTTCTSSYQG